MRGGPSITLVLTLLLAAAAGLFLEQQPVSAAPPLQGGDHAGQSCAECHLDYAANWQMGVHAEAFTKDSFHTAWQNDHGAAGECLDCHTTLYQPSTGEYFAENVTCEACHGLNPADHPPAPIEIGEEAEMCGNCHVGTFDEWRISPHAVIESETGAASITCATCHNPHGQSIRFETADDLCLSCHEAAPESYVHLSHAGDEMAEIACSDCHMFQNQGLGAGLPPDEVEGHRVPNHTMTVSTEPCVACHEQLSIYGDFSMMDVDAALVTERDELLSRVDELETEIAGVLADPPQPPVSVVQLTQGLIIGLGVGITLTWVLSRQNNNSADDDEDNDDGNE